MARQPSIRPAHQQALLALLLRSALCASAAALLGGCAAGIVFGDDGSDRCTEQQSQDCKKAT